MAQSNLFYITIAIVLFILYHLLSCKKIEGFGTFYALPYAMHKDKNDYYPKDTNLIFASNKCCKSCCKQGWPVPFDINECGLEKNSKEEFIYSNYSCNGEYGAGCVCATQENIDLLENRGNNKYNEKGVIEPNNEQNEYQQV
jgi:hypothetical protein